MIDYCSGEKLDSRDNTAREMLLDNKYYTATVQVHSFEDVKSASVWDADNINAEIGAVIFKFGGDLGALDELKRGIDLWQADVQVFVTFFLLCFSLLPQCLFVYLWCFFFQICVIIQQTVFV